MNNVSYILNNKNNKNKKTYGNRENSRIITREV